MATQEIPRLRPATTADAAPLAELIPAVWPDTPADARHIEQVVGRPGRATHVVEMNGRVIGFVDGFVITALPGGPHWQIDLLAVAPAGRGRGLGRRLIETSLLAGRRQRAVVARALIAIENAASQVSFGRAGFQTDQNELLLLLAASDPLPELPNRYGALPVQTLTYNGIWLDPDAGPFAGQLPFIPRQISLLQRPAELDPPAGFLPSGRFHYWQRFI